MRNVRCDEAGLGATTGGILEVFAKQMPAPQVHFRLGAPGGEQADCATLDGARNTALTTDAPTGPVRRRMPRSEADPPEPQPDLEEVVWCWPE